MRPGVGGNRRAGFLAGGALLLLLGFGGCMIVNLLLHLSAPLGGCLALPGGFHVCSGWGWYATTLFALGVLATLVGAGMVWLGLRMPAGPLRLFDTEGRFPPDPSEP
jgi:hypothetical protein